MIVLLMLAFGTLISAIASSLWLMILGRVIQGASASAFPLAYGLIRDTQPPDRVPGGIGLIAASFGIGGFVGVTVAGPAIEAISYHGLFLAIGGIAVLAALAVTLFVPHDPPAQPLRIHGRSVGWMTVALVALLLPLGNGNSWGWFSPAVLGLFHQLELLQLETGATAKARANRGILYVAHEISFGDPDELRARCA